MSLTYDPWAHAQNLGLTIIEAPLEGTMRGVYWHDQRLITLRPGLTRRAARSTLTHEIAHAIAGDRPTPFGPIHRKAEIIANRRTATLLIDAHEYAAAEELHNGHLPAIAHELNVTPKVLHDWIDLLRKVAA